MYIYTQDKKKLLKFSHLEVQKNAFGSANEKYCIMSITTAGAAYDIIGYYPDERTAMNELKNIIMAMNMDAKVYEVM